MRLPNKQAKGAGAGAGGGVKDIYLDVTYNKLYTYHAEYTGKRRVYNLTAAVVLFLNFAKPRSKTEEAWKRLAGKPLDD